MTTTAVNMLFDGKLRNARQLQQTEDISRCFDDGCVDRLATLARLSSHANVETFKTEVRRAASIYLRDSVQPTVNERRKEVEALHRAASRRRYVDLRLCLARLSNFTRDELRERGDRLRPITVLPETLSIDDPVGRDAACESVVTLTQYGGRWVEGRNRPSGRRSKTWKPLLYAPEVRSHPQRREHERSFVMWLQLAWLDAVGTAPALTASAEREGPFVRLVRECFHLVGVPEADAVGMINDLHALRRRQRG